MRDLLIMTAITLFSLAACSDDTRCIAAQATATTVEAAQPDSLTAKNAWAQANAICAMQWDPILNAEAQ